QALGDIRRAYEWTEQAVTCSTRPGMGDFPGDCRTHRAEITRLRGDWAGAESELRGAMAALERWSPGHVGQAWYELGEIELRRGDLAAATDAFDRAAKNGKDPQPGLAMLRLAQGDETVASALLRVAVDSSGDAHLRPASGDRRARGGAIDLHESRGDARHRSCADAENSSRGQRYRASGSTHLHVHRHRRLHPPGRLDG